MASLGISERIHLSIVIASVVTGVFVSCRPVSTPAPPGSAPAPPGSAPAPQRRLSVVGPAELVFEWRRHRCATEDIPDGSARAFRDKAGHVNLIAPHFTNYRFVGGSLDSVRRDCSPIMSSQRDRAPDKFLYAEWLHSFYTFDGEVIYALVHSEWYANLFDPKCRGARDIDGWVNAITMAISVDGGASYRHPPDYIVLRPPMLWDLFFPCSEADTTVFGNFAPSNIVQRGEYYYAVYQFEGDLPDPLVPGTCLMRSRQLERVDAWEVWTQRGWTTSRTALCTPIQPDTLEKMTHSLSYSPYLGAYVLVGTKVEPRPGVYYSLSQDLFSWSEPVRIDIPFSDRELAILHPSLLDPNDTTRNFEHVGREAYLYYVLWNAQIDERRDPFDRDLVRQRVRFD